MASLAVASSPRPRSSLDTGHGDTGHTLTTVFSRALSPLASLASQVLGHQRFIAELLPTLQATSRANPSNPARLISLASLGQMFAPKGGIDYDALRAGGKQLDKWAEYGLSKWGNVALAKYVDAHYGPASGTDAPVIAISVHPGVVATNLARHVADTSSKVYNAALVSWQRGDGPR